MELLGSIVAEEQSRVIKELLSFPVEMGTTWYLLDMKWFRRWKSQVNYDNRSFGFDDDTSSGPGPIDNRGLLTDGSKSVLRPYLLEDVDYVLVPEEAWKKLVEWYTLADNQVPISRRVIKQGYSQICKVEVYLVDLKLCLYNDLERPVVQYFSRTDTLEHVVGEMRRIFHVDDNAEVHLLIQLSYSTYEPVPVLSKTIEDAGLACSQILALETKNADGSWPRQSSSSQSTSGSFYNKSASSSGSISYTSSYTNNSSHNSIQQGLCGLSNLGNTCFMNSALQCMSNVPPLTEYMLSGRWKDELNSDNPLGMRGEIASTYAALIETMWSGKQACAVPRHFKVAVGQFKPEFSGYQQQDSQELMAFLLDGLHEDLNRVRKKPYVAVKETDNRPDEEVAKETWSDYRLRNDSIIVDIFHGLLKSTLVCPDCEKVSIKFDPFCYLSLPLPHKKDRQMTVVFISLKSKVKPWQYKLTVPKAGCVEDLCKATSIVTKVAHNKMAVVDLYNNRFHKLFSFSESLMHITDRDDIYIYEVPVSNNNDPETIVVPVYMREASQRSYNHESMQLFGLPLLVAVPRNRCNYEMLYKCILTQMVRYIRTQDGDSNDEHVSSLNPEDTSESSETGATDDDETMATGTADRLFEIHVVNSYGYTEVDKLPDDGTPIKFEPNWYLSADWSNKMKNKYYDDKEAKAYNSGESRDNFSSAKKQHVSLTDCLKLFTSEERLGEHDLWYCPQCKKHQQASKKFDLWDLPKILVVHLKRFSYSRYSRDKIDTVVDFPIRNLDMSPFLMKPKSGRQTYDLIGVSNHYGGLGGGHYTAYAKNVHKNQWFDFDDSSVRSVAEEDVVTKAAYVLVYQRRSPDSANESH